MQGNQRAASLLVMHVYTLLSNRRLAAASALRPFAEMLANPAEFVQAFLPTMPHDEDFEAYQAFKSVTKEQLKFYQCPNGTLFKK